jgi:hypothetical protein
MEPGPGVRDPRRVVVASYDSYPEAQRAVDYLSDRRFPVERVAIVAEDLRLVEQVTGRIGYGRAALQGAGLGAIIGFIIGFFIGLFSFYVAILWLIYGAIIGLIVGLIGHALSGGQRDFSSIGGDKGGPLQRDGRRGGSQRGLRTSRRVRRFIREQAEGYRVHAPARGGRSRYITRARSAIRAP